MHAIARRLTIVTLMMTIFALGFSALVAEAPHRDLRVRLDTSIPCYHPATPECVAAL